MQMNLSKTLNKQYNMLASNFLYIIMNYLLVNFINIHEFY